MRKTLLSLFVLLGVITSQQSFAHTPFHGLLPSSGTSKTLLSFQVTTPLGQEVKLDDAGLSIGYADNGVCHYYFSERARDIDPNADIKVSPSSDVITADDAMDLFGGGDGCVKLDLVYQGHTITTGDIQFIWNNSTESYTEAKPSFIKLDVQ